MFSNPDMLSVDELLNQKEPEAELPPPLTVSNHSFLMCGPEFIYQESFNFLTGSDDCIRIGSNQNQCTVTAVKHLQSCRKENYRLEDYWFDVR